MTWWDRKSKPEDPPEFVYGKPGTSIPATDPQHALVFMPSDPEPDLATKPEDAVGYCFGYACPEGHVGKTLDCVVGPADSRMICQTCGKVSKLAVVRRTAEYRWRKAMRRYELFGPPSFEWGWFNSWLTGCGLAQGIGDLIWTKYEVVRFLDEGEG